MNNHNRPVSFAVWLFLGPALIHVWWARCVLYSPIQLNTTGLFDLYRLCGGERTILGAGLVFISIAAIASIVLHRFSPWLSLCLLLPQQVTMIVSVLTAWRCIQAGTFADGAVYDPYFISADQVYLFVIGLMHTGLIVHVYIWDGIRKWIKG